MTVQPFVNYNFGKGWYVMSGPVITTSRPPPRQLLGQGPRAPTQRDLRQIF